MQLLGFPGIVIQRPTVSSMQMQMNPSAGVISPPLQIGPPGDPNAAQAPNTGGQGDNVVTMCPDGSTPTSVGCMGPNGVVTTTSVVIDPTAAGMVLAPMPFVSSIWDALVPSSFPWLQLGIGVIGAVIGEVVGRHYKHPTLGAGIGGFVGYLGGALAAQNGAFLGA